jgi:hypothetical protein
MDVRDQGISGGRRYKTAGAEPIAQRVACSGSCRGLRAGRTTGRYEVAARGSRACTSNSRVRFRMRVETFNIGDDTGTPVCLKYDVPFKFTGEIESVTIDLSARTPEDGTEHQKAQAKGARIAPDGE